MYTFLPPFQVVWSEEIFTIFIFQEIMPFDVHFMHENKVSTLKTQERKIYFTTFFHAKKKSQNVSIFEVVKQIQHYCLVNDFPLPVLYSSSFSRAPLSIFNFKSNLLPNLFINKQKENFNCTTYNVKHFSFLYSLYAYSINRPPPHQNSSR